MGLMSRVIANRMGLPQARTRRVAVEQGLRVAMRDGVELPADRYHPRGGGEQPVILVRSPYGRASGWDATARALAERGYQVVLQSTRGTHDAGGSFEPGVAEPADGQDTVAWLRRQPWFPGTLLTWGQSYMGYTQWALASSGPIPEWTAAAIGVAPSDWCSGYTHPRGVFSLGNALYWIDGPARLTRSDTSVLGSFVAAVTRPRRLRSALRHLPMREADERACGEAVEYYQRWVGSVGGDDYASAVDFRDGARHMPPVHLAAGWYDFFLATMLDDYQRLRDAGHEVRLLVGPGKHESGTTKEAGSEQAGWLRRHSQHDHDAEQLGQPVRVYVMGAERWADLSDWPPADCRPTPWYLQPDGGLATGPPTAGLAAGSAASRYRYDPRDPTPNVGGPIPDLPSRYGPTDNRALEARSDVLTFTTAPLSEDLEAIGAVAAHIYFRSSAASADIFVRLCDVDADGRSINVCDGIVRSHTDETGDGISAALVAMSGTAYRFLRGHSLRLQVSSGAHPRFTRNLGTQEPAAVATTLQASNQEVFHSQEQPSHVLLPLRASA